ncbi:MAG: Ig-like domain-containing protein [Acidobacteriota bacterium]|nr:Ig-like domain-containing protein [Acidobacteriota bacterium]
MPAQGFPLNGIILAPNTHYRHWIFQPQGRLIGFVEFRTGPSGSAFTIPKVALGLPTRPDTDGDTLSDDIEFVLGTDPGNTDTDGDGIDDGAAIDLGLEPAASRTGIIGTADTRGTTIDIHAHNDVVIAADSEEGIVVFNVFNRMEPLVIARVDTPGRASAVAGSGNLAAVADGDHGLAVIDITDPPAAAIVRQVGFQRLGSHVQAVAAAGDLAFTGSVDGWLSSVALSSGEILQQRHMGGRIEDIALEAGKLYVYGNQSLHILLLHGKYFSPAGSIGAPGNINSNHGRGRIFVGNGIAWLVHRRGPNTFDVSDPADPRLITLAETPQFGWKQIVQNGAGLGLAAVGPNSPLFDGSQHLSLYDTRDPALIGDQNFLAEFRTPGIARAVTLYNGLCYVADHHNGMHVVNYQPVDIAGQPPTGSLSLSIPGTTVAEGQCLTVTASITDDVQPRNVTFTVDGIDVATDGSFPFELAWTAPTSGASLVTLGARASDTGGNFTELAPISVTVIPDTEPPAVTLLDHPETQPLFTGNEVIITFDPVDNVGIVSVRFFIDGVEVTAYRLAGNRWVIQLPQTPGSYSLTIEVSDAAGNTTLTSPLNLQVRQQVMSREISVFNTGRPDSTDSLSREISVFNTGRSDSTHSLSREVTLFNSGSPRGTARSREVSIENQESPGIRKRKKE